MLSERFILNNNKLPVPYPELVWDPLRCGGGILRRFRRGGEVYGHGHEASCVLDSLCLNTSTARLNTSKTRSTLPAPRIAHPVPPPVTVLCKA